MNEKQKQWVACPLMETIATNVEKYSYGAPLHCKVRGIRNYKRVARKERHKRGGYSANYMFSCICIDRMDDRMKMSACKVKDAAGCSKRAKKKRGNNSF